MVVRKKGEKKRYAKIFLWLHDLRQKKFRGLEKVQKGSFFFHANSNSYKF